MSRGRMKDPARLRLAGGEGRGGKGLRSCRGRRELRGAGGAGSAFITLSQSDFLRHK